MKRVTFNFKLKLILETLPNVPNYATDTLKPFFKYRFLGKENIFAKL